MRTNPKDHVRIHGDAIVFILSGGQDSLPAA